MSNFFTRISFKVSIFLRRREVILFLIFFLISSLSFGLGYLFAKDQNIAPIIIERNIE
ncbi:hypothetical protein KJ671_01530 [Patescibacteria group bacterium]|nr:hypothetical protein [Patescibacteria group bacterium]